VDGQKENAPFFLKSGANRDNTSTVRSVLQTEKIIMNKRNTNITTDDAPRNTIGRRGRRRKRRRSVEYGFWGFLTILLVGTNGIGSVYAMPLEKDASPTTQSTLSETTTSSQTTTASHRAPLHSVTTTKTSHSSSTSISSTRTTTIPGTIVTDSPLVRTGSISLALSSSHSFVSNFSSIGSTKSSTSSSTTESPTILPSPTTDDGDNNDSSNSPEQTTYDFFFLLLAGAIGFAVLGWWIWRRRRKGKTNRDQRRGLEALRRDLEIGRLRRGFLGVVGRGNNNPPTVPEEELPAYDLHMKLFLID
jgi:hypothetical protein